jgi:hypothetical protein
MNHYYLRNDDGIIHTANIHTYSMLEHLVDTRRIGEINLSDLVGKNEDQFESLLGHAKPINLIGVLYLKDSPLLDLKLPEWCNLTVLLDDIHIQGRVKKRYLETMNRAMIIISTYGYCFSMFFPDLSFKTHFLPHSTHYLAEINPDPINKLLLSGRITPEIYPFRELVRKLSEKDTRIVRLEVNCPYRLANENPEMIYGVRYIERLNQYLACFACDASSERPYLLAKHFEIAGSGSLLIAGNPNTRNIFENLGFIDRVNYFAATESNIKDIIDYVLNPINRQEIDRVRAAGWMLVKNRHTCLSRADELMGIIES